MEDIPQPSDEAHSVGDQVQIYVGLGDQDSRFHGTVCEVLEVVTDDLDSETGRSTDTYSYTLRDVKTDEELPISFRHYDLVPVKNSH